MPRRPFRGTCVESLIRAPPCILKPRNRQPPPRRGAPTAYSLGRPTDGRALEQTTVGAKRIGFVAPPGFWPCNFRLPWMVRPTAAGGFKGGPPRRSHGFVRPARRSFQVATFSRSRAQSALIVRTASPWATQRRQNTPCYSGLSDTTACG